MSLPKLWWPGWMGSQMADLFLGVIGGGIMGWERSLPSCTLRGAVCQLVLIVKPPPLPLPLALGSRLENREALFYLWVQNSLEVPGPWGGGEVLSPTSGAPTIHVHPSPDVISGIAQCIACHLHPLPTSLIHCLPPSLSPWRVL